MKNLNKMSNFELNLLEKIFQIQISQQNSTINQHDQSLKFLPKISTFLKSNPNTPLISLLDELIVERLMIKDTAVLLYSSLSFEYARNEGEKNIFKNNIKIQDLIKAVKEKIINYAAVSISIKEMFPDQLPRTSMDGIHAGSFRILDFIMNRGSKIFLEEIFKYFDRENPNFKEELSRILAIQLNTKFKQYTLFDDFTLYLLSSFKDLIDIKAISSNYIAKTLFKENWTGFQIEKLSFLGTYFSLSLLPKRESLLKIDKQLPVPDIVRETIYSQLALVKFMKERLINTQKYLERYNSYSKHLTEILKLLIKRDRILTMK